MSSPEHSDSEQLLIEAGAYRANDLAFGRSPTEPLREKGGVLDPDGWCMKFASAVYLHGTGARLRRRLPRLYKDIEPSEEWAEEVAIVMGLRPVDCRS